MLLEVVHPCTPPRCTPSRRGARMKYLNSGIYHYMVLYHTINNMIYRCTPNTRISGDPPDLGVGFGPPKWGPDPDLQNGGPDWGPPDPQIPPKYPDIHYIWGCGGLVCSTYSGE